MGEYQSISFPAPLKKGDRIAIISPASAVREEYVAGAVERFIERGYDPVVMPAAVGRQSGSFAASKSERLLDLLDALQDPDIKAIFCARGGYGCVQMLQNLSLAMVSSHPKWIIGFSDVSALLAMWYKSGIASIHGPMAKHLATRPAGDFSTQALFHILESGGNFNYLTSSHPLNRPGKVKGILRGGNFAVLNGLAATPYDILDASHEDNDIILFLEDISEAIYAVERMLWRLNLSGTLMKVKGIIFGEFTEYKPDKNFATMEEMIHYWLDMMMVPDIPVVFHFPVGHVDLNYPLVEGATVELEVTEEKVSLHTLSSV